VDVADAADAPSEDAPSGDGAAADVHAPGDGGVVRLLGQSCGSTGECVSGFCEQGVCCQTSCSDVCRSCAVAGQTGVCALVPAGQDPLGQCPAATCNGATHVPAGVCNGGGACAPGPTASVTCGSAVTCFAAGCVDVSATCWNPNSLPGAQPQISLGLGIADSGGTPVALSDITLRYWFTEESPATEVVDCDYAQLLCTNLTFGFAPVSPARTGANAYMQAGFARSAGALAGFGDTGDIRLRIHASDYSTTYDVTNDYSEPTSTTPVQCPNVTVYYKGALVWGTEP
jgi:hypothetical protein